MNYYNPNYYPNYNNFNPQQSTQNNNQTLCGKVVDSIDVAKASEVPMGGFGIFPKADFSEMYVKTWNNDGTTKVLSFKPFEEKDERDEILERLTSLENKVSKISSSTNKKEVKKNDF